MERDANAWQVMCKCENLESRAVSVDFLLARVCDSLGSCGGPHFPPEAPSRRSDPPEGSKPYLRRDRRQDRATGGAVAPRDKCGPVDSARVLNP
jgi:hypothetical protein